MTAETDPYAVLGLPRTASPDEVKRAYRRLAKANHPDAAGEAALPRFLAIQAAYTRIVGVPDGAGGRRPARPAARPWDADPTRASATHRAYGGRSRRARPASGPAAGGAPASGGTRPAGGRGAGGTAGSSTSTGAAGTAGAASAGPPPGAAGPDAAGAARPGTGTGAGSGAGDGTTPPRGRRAPNKATLGSTSYDGADAEPFEPDWGGASWYGTSSGTYWTLNPKEYADPRKHGPEYQARARRKSRARPVDPLAAATAGAAAPDPDVEMDDPTTAGETVQPPPTRTTSTWWAAGAGTLDDAPPPTSASAPQPGPAAARSTATSAAAAPPTPELESTTVSIRDWLEGGDTGLAGRVGRAVIGWAPLALGIGWLAGEMSGCARFSASCDGSVAPISWLAQLGVLLLLLLVPRLATIATVATAVTLAAAVPGTLLLTATGGATDTATGRDALGGLLVIAWVVGVALGIARELRRSEPAPVS